ncbi:putative cytochrome P450 monooxygenase [Aspergillus fijiensis CBS 313.89]|uniref:Cytochrome P450 n=1 Tax=Aspergillus fijiensis CBS 313.89 TaxID=1448319 RepID=A0A8G1RTZ8_9EURO|nr:cytochrome P450 [Aspergillus fijiensis CBS 313.89]RAK77815.1 cytochrome P450 [Aspergillus fijiensis CBS 313.89]
MIQAVIAVLLALLASAYTFRQFAHLDWVLGPLISRISWWWHIYLRNSPHDGRRLSELHARYGRIVRLGTNRISVSDPAIISQNVDVWAHGERDDQTPTSQWARFLEYEGINDSSTKELLDALKRYQSIELVASLKIFAATLIDKRICDPASNAAQIQTQAINARSLPDKPSIVEYILFQSPVSSLKRYRGRQLTQCSMMPIHALTTPAGLHKPNLDSTNILNDNTLASDELTTETESLITAFASVFSHLLQYPERLTTLQYEIDSAYNTGSLSSTPRWRELSRLPYLCAVMKESMRLTCTADSEKEFPASAVSGNLRSEFIFPSGTIITCNAYVAQFNDTIYGDDAHAFRPERWLIASVPQRKLMDRAILLFHPGLHTNPKLRAAWLELKKVVVQILLNFNIQPFLVDHHARQTSNLSAVSTIVTTTPRMPEV